LGNLFSYQQQKTKYYAIKMTALTTIDLKRNQNLLLGYFLYSTLNGALRKWVFAGSSGISGLLLLVQIMLPFLIVFLMKKEKIAWHNQPLFIYAFALIACALNPMNQSLFHGIFGVVLHLGFWFIMITYLNERDAFPFENIINPIVLVCIAQAILTFVQFGLPPTHVMNRYESTGEVSGFEGNIVRVIGTFSYISGYSAFLFFFGLFAWALMAEGKRPIIVIYSVAGLGLISAFMNGSRMVVVTFILSLIFGFINYGSFVQKIKAIAVIVLLFLLSLIYDVGKQATFIENSYNAFTGRVETGRKTGESNSRTGQVFYQITHFRGDYPMFGLGLGSTYQGAIAQWGRSLQIKEYGYFEEEPERVIIEGGFFLFIIRALLFIYLASQLKIPLLYSVPILFCIFFFSQLVFNTYQTSFTFLGIALLDKIYFLRNQIVEAP
jgi:hypothetical protein